MRDCIKLCWDARLGNVLGNEVANKLAQSIDMPINETVETPISYYVIIEEAGKR